MKVLMLLPCLLLPATASINFGSDSPPEAEAGVRLGLLATDLGLHPAGAARQAAKFELVEEDVAERVPGPHPAHTPDHVHSPGHNTPGHTHSPAPAPAPQCCCLPAGQTCQDPLDLVGQGLIDPRIVNRDPAALAAEQREEDVECPLGHTACCYPAELDISPLGRSCIPPQPARHTGYADTFVQGCAEYSRVTGYGKQCGTRSYTGRVASLSHGQTGPGEFPWTCILLNQDNDFLGTCALIPNDFSNDNSAPTRKVLTAAHKLKSLEEADLLKVRVGEWDASGYNQPEQFRHEEYTVTRILKHPEMSNTRLSDDIALLYTDRDINLDHAYVNTACLPGCEEQFNHQFHNGTGARCWVAGWGKDEFEGSFQFIPRKVDLPLVAAAQCEPALRAALDRREAGTGARFSLHHSELCAGGEPGKDACTGDGGSPLVCQAQSGRWTLVGLVAWGVGCASETPGVYVNVAHFRDWINAN